MIKHLLFGFMGMLLTFMVFSCTQLGNSQQDSFYQDDGGFNDYGRFPLIKPYDAIIVDNEHGWYIELHIPPSEKEIYYYLGLVDVQKVAVENGVIMIYTPTKTSVDENVGQKVLYWFVIVPDKSIETGFDNENDFLEYVQEYGIKAPVWIDADSAYQQFKRTGCLDWISDCN